VVVEKVKEFRVVVEYPEPKVVVADEYRRPPVPTLSAPTESVESLKGAEIVDEAVEKNPLSNPRVVVVELYPTLEVNGNAPEEVTNPASLLNQERLIEDDAVEFTLPLDPMYANPCESEERFKGAEMVDDAVEKNPLSNPRAVVVELYPVLAVNGKVKEETVTGDEPMMVAVAQDEPPEHESVVVDTVPKVEGVPTPVQYAS